MSIYAIVIILILSWQLILLTAYGLDKDWQKSIDNKGILLARKIKSKIILSVFHSNLIYIAAINLIVASSTLQLKYMDTVSEPKYMLIFIITLLIWIVSLCIKIDLDKKNIIEEYITEFFIAIEISILFNLIEEFTLKLFLFLLIILFIILFKITIDFRRS